MNFVADIYLIHLYPQLNFRFPKNKLNFFFDKYKGINILDKNKKLATTKKKFKKTLNIIWSLASLKNVTLTNTFK